MAYQLAVDWGITLGLSGKPEMWRALLSGLLGMAFLRSAIATVRVGDKEIGVGFISIVDIFKARAERNLDQRLTERRLERVSEIVEKLGYKSTRKYFESVTLMVLPSLTEMERDSIGRGAKKIEDLECDDDTKMLLLAMFLQQWLGTELLVKVAADAARRFKSEIQHETEHRKSTLTRLRELKDSLK